MSSSTYYRYLNKIVYPFTYNSWLQNQADTIEEVLVSEQFINQFLYYICYSSNRESKIDINTALKTYEVVF